MDWNLALIAMRTSALYTKGVEFTRWALKGAAKQVFSDLFQSKFTHKTNLKSESTFCVLIGLSSIQQLKKQNGDLLRV